MTFTPTDEQNAILDSYRLHDRDVVITAGAGTGKTTTLRLLADSDPGQRILYLAYNNAIAKEARTRFPAHVDCRTAHSLAFASVGRYFQHRLKAPRPRGRDVALALRINNPIRVSDHKMFSPEQLARITMRTIDRFCYTGDPQPALKHVPWDIPGAEEPQERSLLADVVVPAAVRAWNDDITRHDGKLRFTHDAYLKIFALQGIKLDYDRILFDEAQDANGVVADLISHQAHAQRVLVGDSNQAIYGWRGAKDVMADWPAAHRHNLTESWRFGPTIAGEANKWLTVIGSPLRLTGRNLGDRIVPHLDRPDAVLCRSNAAAIGTLIDCHARGVKAAIVGGGNDVKNLAEASEELRERGWTSHPELAGFESWQQVVDYVESDHGGEDFKVAVSLIEKYGAQGVIDAITKAVPEHRAQIVVSTAHKAKGREWDSVRVATDFIEPRDDNECPRAEAMLAYVTVTRAKRNLDRGGLAWVDHQPALVGSPLVAPAEPAACGAAMGGYLGVLCILDDPHPGRDHENDLGWTWTDDECADRALLPAAG